MGTTYDYQVLPCLPALQQIMSPINRTHYTKGQEYVWLSSISHDGAWPQVGICCLTSLASQAITWSRSSANWRSWYNAWDLLLMWYPEPMKVVSFDTPKGCRIRRIWCAPAIWQNDRQYSSSSLVSIGNLLYYIKFVETVYNSFSTGTHWQTGRGN